LEGLSARTIFFPSTLGIYLDCAVLRWGWVAWGWERGGAGCSLGLHEEGPSSR